MVISSALLYPFKECIGIEYLKNLHNISLFHKNKYENEFPKYLEIKKELFPYHTQLSKVDFINSNFLETDWSDGTFVFTNSTTFTNDIMEGLFDRAQLLQKNAFFINTTKHIPIKYIHKWETFKPITRMMSWGLGTIFIHRKIK